MSSSSCPAAWWAEAMRAATEQDILRSELRLGRPVSAASSPSIMLAIIYAGVVHHINPPSNIETDRPEDPPPDRRIHRRQPRHAGRGGRPGHEPRSSRRSSRSSRNASSCRRTAPVTLRFATPDVIHGILVTGTNVNTMVVPGYVSQVHTVFTQDRRPADAVPRVLRARTQPDVGDACGSCRRTSSSPDARRESDL